MLDAALRNGYNINDAGKLASTTIPLYQKPHICLEFFLLITHGGGSDKTMLDYLVGKTAVILGTLGMVLCSAGFFSCILVPSSFEELWCKYLLVAGMLLTMLAVPLELLFSNVYQNKHSAKKTFETSH